MSMHTGTPIHSLTVLPASSNDAGGKLPVVLKGAFVGVSTVYHVIKLLTRFLCPYVSPWLCVLRVWSVLTLSHGNVDEAGGVRSPTPNPK